MTPTWAMPRALPPPNATPTVGRFSSRRIRRCAIGPGRRRDGLCDFLNWRGASRATQCQQPREEPRQPLACRVRSRQLPHSTTPCQRYHSRRFQLAPLPFDCEDDGASSRCQRAMVLQARWPSVHGHRKDRAAGVRSEAARDWLAVGNADRFRETGLRLRHLGSGRQLTTGTRRMIHRAEKIRNPTSRSADRDNAHYLRAGGWKLVGPERMPQQAAAECEMVDGKSARQSKDMRTTMRRGAAICLLLALAATVVTARARDRGPAR